MILNSKRTWIGNNFTSSVYSVPECDSHGQQISTNKQQE